MKLLFVGQSYILQIFVLKKQNFVVLRELKFVLESNLCKNTVH